MEPYGCNNLVILLSRKSLTSNKPKDIIKLHNNTKHEITNITSHNVKLDNTSWKAQYGKGYKLLIGEVNI